MKQNILKQGACIAAIALLAALSGCPDDALPQIVIGTITVNAENYNQAIPENGYVYLEHGDTFEVLNANVTGDTNVDFTWSFVGGDDVIHLNPKTGSTAIIVPKKPGLAKIKLVVSRYYVSKETELYVAVTPPGNEDWAFHVFEGTAKEIFNEIFVPPNNTQGKTIRLEANKSGVTYSWENLSPGIINVSGAAGTTFTITDNPAENISENATVRIKAAWQGKELVRDIIVTLKEEFAEGVLFEWYHDNNPLTGSNLREEDPYKGPGAIYFSPRGADIAIDGGAFKLGGAHNDPISTLVIGGGRIPYYTNTDIVTHVPGGQFDLSNGRFRLSIDYDIVSSHPGTTVYFRASVNNNTSSQGNSVLENLSNLRTFTNETDLRTTYGTSSTPVGISCQVSRPSSRPNEGRINITIDASLRFNNDPSLKDAYICLFTDAAPAAGNANWLRITGIKLEKLD